MSKPIILIVANVPSPNTRLLFDAVVHGASTGAGDDVEIVAKTPLEANSDDVLNAQAIIIGTTENFGLRVIWRAFSVYVHIHKIWTSLLPGYYYVK